MRTRAAAVLRRRGQGCGGQGTRSILTSPLRMASPRTSGEGVGRGEIGPGGVRAPVGGGGGRPRCRRVRTARCARGRGGPRWRSWRRHRRPRLPLHVPLPFPCSAPTSPRAASPPAAAIAGIVTVEEDGVLPAAACVRRACGAPTPTTQARGKAEQGEEDAASRSEERRVGKECGYQCRSRWSPYH